MNQTLVITAGLFILAGISGMLGLGVAFAAIPFLGLFLHDLVHQVQPLSLLLNGVTALFALIGFAQSGYIDWKKAGILSVVTTICAPVGALSAQYIPQRFIWFIYFASVAYLAYRLFRPAKGKNTGENFRLAVILAIPISVLSGFLGVGPGFLLMPTLIMLNFEPKKAAGMNALAVMPPSFSSLIPHLATASWNPGLMIPLLLFGAAGSFIGARLSSLYVPSQRIKQIFGVLIAVMTMYKLLTLFK